MNWEEGQQEVPRKTGDLSGTFNRSVRARFPRVQSVPQTLQYTMNELRYTHVSE